MCSFWNLVASGFKPFETYVCPNGNLSDILTWTSTTFLKSLSSHSTLWSCYFWEPTFRRVGGPVLNHGFVTFRAFAKKTLKVIKHRHPNSNASGLRHFTKTCSNWFLNMFSSLTGTMFLKFPFISETLAVVLLGEFRCFSFFLGGGLLSFAAWTCPTCKTQWKKRQLPNSLLPKYLCLTLF